MKTPEEIAREEAEKLARTSDDAEVKAAAKKAAGATRGRLAEAIEKLNQAIASSGEDIKKIKADLEELKKPKSKGEAEKPPRVENPPPPPVEPESPPKTELPETEKPRRSWI